ncbi:zinc finger CCHC domain-containing protein 7 isoform X2 [Dicentrarchus labrax]|uniref:zinc finger CCHC domain-containing protein 7 isoform X2 n=1 Tax=Dicentrarchus labrax TaxID=13489 RepID=UPI0021F5C93F|nr:zinc finger CCHC domain-containing protein 7 isoform X2 [Dicentrarchus labrax]
MYCMYQDREELEDDLYQEDEEDSEGSEANSELEFRLYSQLHYSSNAGEIEEQRDRGEDAEGQECQQLEVTEKSLDVDAELEHTGESGPPSPNISKLLQHLKKKKGEKRDKQKKGKSNPKGQRSSSSFFEEVIVIDSSPDVISISEGDTADDDEGICALKGKGLHQLQTSTPAQQGTQKRKGGLGVPVTVDSSSSESDSEESESKSESSESSGSSESSDSSDSDGLENWMILGPGNQDGDQSISLNLEGRSDCNADVGEEEGGWLVSDKDKEAQIYNKDKGAKIVVQRLSNRYYTSKNVQCRNCDKNGHLSKNCPEPKKLLACFLCGTPGHLAIQCPNKHCNNCGLPGHVYESCNEKAYWHKQCHRCSMPGHFFDACPEIWRQYHITACTRQRMFKVTFPTTPFINHYDTVEDINRRQHRIKMKVKELKEKGIFPASSETPVTPGPPKKKQKISHHKNNHQHNHRPHQSSNNHRHNPTHIFFNDSHDFTAPTPKTKYNKYKQQESTSNVKPWKPKRPVPKSRDPPAKLILDEADDFPRGRGKGENTEMMKKKKKRMRKAKQVPPEGHRDGRPDRLHWTVTGEMQGSESKAEKGRKKKRNRARRTTDKKLAEQMYPTDENLFIIKQRKRKR